MNIIFRKRPKKYLKKIDKNTYTKIMKAIDGLNELSGDIVKLKGTDMFRLKIYHYRIIFTYDSDTQSIVIEEIDTRGDVYR